LFAAFAHGPLGREKIFGRGFVGYLGIGSQVPRAINCLRAAFRGAAD